MSIGGGPGRNPPDRGGGGTGINSESGIRNAASKHSAGTHSESGNVTPEERKGRGLTGSTLRGAAWALSGTGLEALLQIAVLAILARLVSPEAFGLVSAAIVVVHFATIFVDLGVGSALVQRPRLDRHHLQTAFVLTLLAGALTVGVLLVSAPWIAGLFRMEGLAPVLRVMSLVFAARCVGIVAERLLQRDLKFRLIAAIGVVSYGIGYGLVGVSLAFLGFGVWALVAAYLGQAIVATISFLVKQPHPKALRPKAQAAKELLGFGGGFTLSRVFNQVAIEGDNFVVGRWLGAEALGIYGRAYQLMAMPATLFGKSLDKVLFPAMAKVQHKRALLAMVYKRGVALIALTVLPASVVLCILAPELVAVLLGPQWTSAIVPLQLLTLGMLFRTSYKMSDSLARATGAVYRRAWRQLVYAAFVVLGAWLGSFWGLAGVSVAVLCALAVNFLLMAHLCLSLTGLGWGSFLSVQLRSFLPTAVCAGAALLAAALLRNAQVPAPLTLLASAGTALVAGLLFVRSATRLALGSEGIWLLQTLAGYLPRRYRARAIQARWLRG